MKLSRKFPATKMNVFRYKMAATQNSYQGLDARVPPKNKTHAPELLTQQIVVLHMKHEILTVPTGSE